VKIIKRSISISSYGRRKTLLKDCKYPNLRYWLNVGVMETHLRRIFPLGTKLKSCIIIIRLGIGLSIFSPFHSIFGYSHPAPASRPTQIVTPPGLRASYTTFTETRSPLQNSFSPVIVGSTADESCVYLYIFLA
jgi:hypothetical protein